VIKNQNFNLITDINNKNKERVNMILESVRNYINNGKNNLLDFNDFLLN